MRKKEHPVGSLLPDSLKGALFQQEGGSCPQPLSLKKKKREREAQVSHANPCRGHNSAPRQTAYYPTCRGVIAQTEGKAVKVFKCFVWRQLKG